MSGVLIASGETEGVQEQLWIDPSGIVPGHAALTVFDGQFATIDLTPAQTREVAAHLIACADQIEREDHA